MTLQEHIDALDGMVENGADKPKIRSQIAFVGREVAALEADYARAIDDNAKLREAQTQLEKTHAEAMATLSKKHAKTIRALKKAQEKEILRFTQRPAIRTFKPELPDRLRGIDQI